MEFSDSKMEKVSSPPYNTETDDHLASGGCSSSTLLTHSKFRDVGTQSMTVRCKVAKVYDNEPSSRVIIIKSDPDSKNNQPTSVVISSQSQATTLQQDWEENSETYTKVIYVKTEPEPDVSSSKQTGDIVTLHENELKTEKYYSVNDAKESKLNIEYNCRSCNSSHLHSQNVEAHEKVCSKRRKLRKHACLQPSCKRSFFHKSALKKHISQDHPEVENYQQKPECDSTTSASNDQFLDVEFSLDEDSGSDMQKDGITYKESLDCCTGGRIGKNQLHSLYREKFTSPKYGLGNHTENDHIHIKSLVKSASNYTCNNCERTFAYLSTYKSHEKACGSFSKLKKTRCIHPSCKREFFHKCRLMQHIQRDHPELEYCDPKDNVYECQRCERKYSHLKSLKSHTRKSCGKAVQLKRTVCIHPSCTREFFHRSRMREHISKDHPDLNTPENVHDNGFKCQNCGTMYSHLKSLQRHLDSGCLKEGRLKKTECIHPSCDKKFFHMSSMLKHLEKDHEDMEVDIIEKTFNSMTSFKLWKEEEEMKSFSYFSTRHSKEQSNGRTYLCFVCQYHKRIKSAEGFDHFERSFPKKLKLEQDKTGIICPARMLVNEQSDGSFSVKYVKTHNHNINKTFPIDQQPEQRTFRKYELYLNDMKVSSNNKQEDRSTVESRTVCDSKELNGEVIADAAVNSSYFDYILKPNCGYVHTVEKANEAIALFQQQTSHRFVCLKVQKSFGKDDWQSSNHKVLWEQEELRASTLPEFDGVPYILIGTKTLRCQYDSSRRAYLRMKTRKMQDGDLLQHTSRKVGCPARIFLKDIIKFPDYQVKANTREEKQKNSQQLREALKQEQFQGDRRIYIEFPKECKHRNHRKRLLYRHRDTLGKKLCAYPCWDADLTDQEFLQMFRVTKPVYQLLVDEWQKMEIERLESAGLPTMGMQPLDTQVLAALYYFGSQDRIVTASAKFRVKPANFKQAVIRFTEFLLGQSSKYLQWPPVEERVKIAEVIQSDCGFPGVFGAMDAALIPMQTPFGDDRYLYACSSRDNGSKCAFVLQFIVDHRLVFRDIHLDSPKTGSRIQIFQESEAWMNIQKMTSAETHLIAPSVYPLAPAVMTPHMSDRLSYQEALYNNNHQECQKLTTNAMTVFKSRFQRLQCLDNQLSPSFKILKAACILHNIALINEGEMILNDLNLEYNSEADEDGWLSNVVEEVVAEIGILGGEEKRHYLTTVMLPR